MPAAEGAGAAPKGSAPKTSGAAGAASRDVEKVDHTSAPGEPAPQFITVETQNVFIGQG